MGYKATGLSGTKVGQKLIFLSPNILLIKMRSRPDAAGVFTGHAMSGRLKVVLSAPLTISALSWNLFGAGDPSLVLMKSGGAIVKGAAEPGAPAD